MLTAGRGVPTTLAHSNNRAETVDQSRIPSTDVALQFAEADAHHFQTPSTYGSDPLEEHPALSADRDRQFAANVNILDLYNSVLVGQITGLRSAIRLWTDLSTV